MIFGEAEGLGQGVFEVEAGFFLGVMPRNSAASPTAQPFFFRRVCSRLFQLVADEAGAVGGDSLEAGGDELAGLGGGVDGPGVEAEFLVAGLGSDLAEVAGEGGGVGLAFEADVDAVELGGFGGGEGGGDGGPLGGLGVLF